MIVLAWQIACVKANIDHSLLRKIYLCMLDIDDGFSAAGHTVSRVWFSSVKANFKTFWALLTFDLDLAVGQRSGPLITKSSRVARAIKKL